MCSGFTYQDDQCIYELKTVNLRMPNVRIFNSICTVRVQYNWKGGRRPFIILACNLHMSLDVDGTRLPACTQDNGEERSEEENVGRLVKNINSVRTEMWPMRGESNFADLALANWWLRCGTNKLEAILFFSSFLLPPRFGEIIIHILFVYWKVFGWCGTWGFWTEV